MAKDDGLAVDSSAVRVMLTPQSVYFAKVIVVLILRLGIAESLELMLGKSV
jgi:hypothetical protein